MSTNQVEAGSRGDTWSTFLVGDRVYEVRGELRLQHGSLVIDSREEVWLAIRGRAAPRSNYISFTTFMAGAPAEPTLAYADWRIMLGAGLNAQELCQSKFMTR